MRDLSSPQFAEERFWDRFTGRLIKKGSQGEALRWYVQTIQVAWMERKWNPGYLLNTDSVN